jgi:hypothetical protein
LADTLLASVPFSVPADAPSADEGDYVVKDAEVVFRADKYEFPAELGGPFEMTPADIKAALARLPAQGVRITDEHNPRSVFYRLGLGHLLPRPAPDYALFGGKVRLKRPVAQMLPPGPIRLSANFRRADKTLTDVSLTETPRIPDAACFAAFAAFARSEGAAVETTPHGKARMQMLHDTAAEGGALCGGKKKDAADAGMAERQGVGGFHPPNAHFTSAGERDALQAVHDTAAGMGATCNVSAESKAKKKGDEAMAAYSTEYGPAPSPREKELEARLAKIEEERAAERAAAKAAEEARFSAQVASFAAQAGTFADSLRDRLLPYQRPLCVADYCRCAEDDLRQPAEVHFSTADGKPWKGTRLEACKARWQALPPHGLTSEALKSRTDLTALFAANDGPKTEQEKRVAEAKEHAEAWGRRNGGAK